jgi:hypothetical protein
MAVARGHHLALVLNPSIEREVALKGLAENVLVANGAMDMQDVFKRNLRHVDVFMTFDHEKEIIRTLSPYKLEAVQRNVIGHLGYEGRRSELMLGSAKDVCCGSLADIGNLDAKGWPRAGHGVEPNGVRVEVSAKLLPGIILSGFSLPGGRLGGLARNRQLLGSSHRLVGGVLPSLHKASLRLSERFVVGIGTSLGLPPSAAGVNHRGAQTEQTNEVQQALVKGEVNGLLRSGRRPDIGLRAFLTALSGLAALALGALLYVVTAEPNVSQRHRERKRSDDE